MASYRLYPATLTGPGTAVTDQALVILTPTRVMAWTGHDHHLHLVLDRPYLRHPRPLDVARELHQGPLHLTMADDLEEVTITASAAGCLRLTHLRHSPP